MNLATLTATRSDALAAGGSYPAITLTVNVAANAPASVTNTATVSGGGEVNTGNDIATRSDQHPQHVGTALDHERHPLAHRRRAGGGQHHDPGHQFQRRPWSAAARRPTTNCKPPGPTACWAPPTTVSVPLSASYTGTTATLSFPALTPGVYRLTVCDTITDNSGNEARRQRRRPARRQLRPRFRGRSGRVQPAFWHRVDLHSSGGGNQYAIVAGDFNGDGKPDLAVANGSNVVVLLGNGRAASPPP